MKARQRLITNTQYGLTAAVVVATTIYFLGPIEHRLFWICVAGILSSTWLALSTPIVQDFFFSEYKYFARMEEGRVRQLTEEEVSRLDNPATYQTITGPIIGVAIEGMGSGQVLGSRKGWSVARGERGKPMLTIIDEHGEPFRGMPEDLITTIETWQNLNEMFYDAVRFRPLWEAVSTVMTRISVGPPSKHANAVLFDLERIFEKLKLDHTQQHRMFEWLDYLDKKREEKLGKRRSA
ncbi:MAG: hypothetical protein A3A27_00490 [Candidatus Wildermuthbacteria bacterium RIFCSPLOWO2_01_FULL_47_18]|uniref:Uncharacterized protein n=1 Tax=Candidatus Wildermuthbacteria bacterium RIFCSPLOWO2_01_FULL_47_18 TaxID=1802460 RepID=A0A1G2RIU0_9BACT|nr:MAG: hypothetical protein A3A27_00490 [Candidatus Wildermuthbacteria bacterium RIFCSPLOWO2_01_FULL_47_18]OHB17084.1 MAG: hypothetical protein A2749_03085 [Parcubacteria group bacterium RIFCSPHIGHO2_01_FULL_45_26]